MSDLININTLFGDDLQEQANLINDAGLAKATLKMLATVAAKKQKSKDTPDMAKKLPEKPKQVMLPLWPDDKRALPNAFIRSALFGILKKSAKRTYLQEIPIFAGSGLKISYNGPQLDQSDQDVYLAVLNRMKDLPMGEPCEITTYELLKSMGLTEEGKNYKILQRNITRMVATAVNVETDKYSYIGSLIEVGKKDKDTKKWTIQLNPDLLILFENDRFTHIDFNVRKDLKGQLAKWLHSFYSSHAEPFPYKIETLRELCGSETKELWKFKQQIQKALNEIVESSKNHNQIVKYEIINGCVHFQKTNLTKLLKKMTGK